MAPGLGRASVWRRGAALRGDPVGADGGGLGDARTRAGGSTGGRVRWIRGGIPRVGGRRGAVLVRVRRWGVDDVRRGERVRRRRRWLCAWARRRSARERKRRKRRKRKPRRRRRRRRRWTAIHSPPRSRARRRAPPSMIRTSTTTTTNATKSSAEESSTRWTTSTTRPRSRSSPPRPFPRARRSSRCATFARWKRRSDRSRDRSRGPVRDARIDPSRSTRGYAPRATAPSRPARCSSVP